MAPTLRDKPRDHAIKSSASSHPPRSDQDRRRWSRSATSRAPQGDRALHIAARCSPGFTKPDGRKTGARRGSLSAPDAAAVVKYQQTADDPYPGPQRVGSLELGSSPPRPVASPLTLARGAAG